MIVFLAFVVACLALATTTALVGWNVADALREVYNAINEADEITEHGDIQRRVALRAVADAATRRGVVL